MPSLTSASVSSELESEGSSGLQVKGTVTGEYQPSVKGKVIGEF